MAMTPEERAADRERMLRRLHAAAASAATAEATDDQIEATVASGLAEGRRTLAALRGETAPATSPEPGRRQPLNIDPNGALADLLRATGDL